MRRVHNINEDYEDYQRRNRKEVDYSFLVLAILLIVIGLFLILAGVLEKIKHAQDYDKELANWQELKKQNPLLPDSPPTKTNDNFFTSSFNFDTINKFNLGLSLFIIGIVFFFVLKYSKR